MHLWKGNKKLGSPPPSPPPHLDKIQKNSNFFSWNLPLPLLWFQMADKFVFENEDSDDQKAEEEEQTTLAARDTLV